jgi:hypothetical protein
MIWIFSRGDFRSAALMRRAAFPWHHKLKSE